VLAYKRSFYTLVTYTLTDTAAVDILSKYLSMGLALTSVRLCIASDLTFDLGVPGGTYALTTNVYA